MQVADAEVAVLVEGEETIINIPVGDDAKAVVARAHGFTGEERGKVRRERGFPVVEPLEEACGVSGLEHDPEARAGGLAVAEELGRVIGAFEESRRWRSAEGGHELGGVRRLRRSAGRIRRQDEEPSENPRPILPSRGVTEYSRKTKVGFCNRELDGRIIGDKGRWQWLRRWNGWRLEASGKPAVAGVSASGNNRKRHEGDHEFHAAAPRERVRRALKLGLARGQTNERRPMPLQELGYIRAHGANGRLAFWRAGFGMGVGHGVPQNPRCPRGARPGGGGPWRPGRGGGGARRGTKGRLSRSASPRAISWGE